MEQDSAESIARRKGFYQGLSVSFSAINVLSVTWTILVTRTAIPYLGEVFAQLKVPMPSITMLLFDHHGAASAILVVAAVTGALFAWRRGDRRSTVVVNVLGIGASMAWLALVQAGMVLPMMTVLEHLRRP